VYSENWKNRFLRIKQLTSIGTYHLPLEIQPRRKRKGIASDSDYSDKGGDNNINAKFKGRDRAG
jgi:hypothetical protein